jgi:hypothetical protein
VGCTGVEEKSLYTAWLALRPTCRESDENGHDVFSCNPPDVTSSGQGTSVRRLSLYARMIRKRKAVLLYLKIDGGRCTRLPKDTYNYTSNGQ